MNLSIIIYIAIGAYLLGQMLSYAGAGASLVLIVQCMFVLFYADFSAKPKRSK